MKNFQKQMGRLKSRRRAAPKGDRYRVPGSMNAHKGSGGPAITHTRGGAKRERAETLGE